MTTDLYKAIGKFALDFYENSMNQGFCTYVHILISDLKKQFFIISDQQAAGFREDPCGERP